MTSKSETFQNIASAAQALTVTAAIVVGGIWILWTFNLLDIPRLQRELYQQAQIDIEVNARHVEHDGKDLIDSTAKITNNGNRNAYLDYDRVSTFTVCRVDSEENIEPIERRMGYRVLRSGETVEYPFVTQVDEPGLYIATFSVPLSRVEEEHHWEVVEAEKRRQGEEVGSRTGLIRWVGSTFVYVQGNSGQETNLE